MIEKALNLIRPNCSWSINGDTIIWNPVLDENKQPTGKFYSDNFYWSTDNNQAIPTKEEIEDAVSVIRSQFESQKYQRARKLEYPPIEDLADALYWQSQGDDSKMTKYIAAVEAVKQKYPKGSV